MLKKMLNNLFQKTNRDDEPVETVDTGNIVLDELLKRNVKITVSFIKDQNKNLQTDVSLDLYK